MATTTHRLVSVSFPGCWFSESSGWSCFSSGVLSSVPVRSRSPPSFSSITTSPSCPSSALPSPPPSSSTHLSNVSFSPPSSVDRSLLPLATDSSSVTLFPCHHVTSDVISAASSSPGSLPSDSSSTPLISTSTHSSISPAYFSHVLPLSSPSHSTQCHYLLPSQFLSSFSNVSPFSNDSPVSASHYHPSRHISLPPPPPPIFTPCTSHSAVTVYPPSSSPTSSVSSSVLYPPVSLPHTAPVLPPVPPPCCSCSALLPRLLSAHRLEVRRLLRGALATLSRRLDSLERRTRRNVRKKRTRNAVDGGRGPCSHGGFLEGIVISRFQQFHSVVLVNCILRLPPISFSVSHLLPQPVPDRPRGGSWEEQEKEEKTERNSSKL